MSSLDVFDRTDVIHRADLARLAATLDVPAPDTVPPLWHWISFLDHSPTAALGADGHPREGGLIPEPPYPRRMFAGGRVRWIGALPLDTPIRRIAEVGEVEHKDSSRGPLAFVTVRFDYRVDDRSLVVEEQDLVYLPDTPRSTREAGSGARSGARPTDTGDLDDPAPDLFAEAVFREPALFRFSALTFNSHRIHYDLPFAKEVEGYPGLVVHGPLLAVRMLVMVGSSVGDETIERFSFRAVAAAYCGASIRFLGRRSGQDLHLEARSEGRVVMSATVGLRPTQR